MSENKQSADTENAIQVVEKRENQAKPLFDLVKKHEQLEAVANENKDLNNSRGYVNAKMQQIQNEFEIDSIANKVLAGTKKNLTGDFHKDYVALFGATKKSDFEETFREKFTMSPARRMALDAELKAFQEALSEAGKVDVESSDVSKTAPMPEPSKDSAAKEPSAPQATGENNSSDLPEEVKKVPDHLRHNYFYSDEKVFQTGEKPQHVFTDHATKIVVHAKEPEKAQVQHLIDFAEEKNWSSIKVTGTKDFRRQVWLEASMRDIAVTGYSPSKEEIAQVEALKASRKNNSQNTNTDTENAIEKHQRTAETAQQASPAANGKKRSFYGELIASGVAAYQFDATKEQSPYVRLKDESGVEHTVWGVDLPRALADGKVSVGDKILLREEGRKPVEIPKPVYENGSQTPTRYVTEIVERNTWSATKKESETDANARREAVLKLFDSAKNANELVEISKANPQYQELRNAAVVANLDTKQRGISYQDSAIALRSKLVEGKAINVRVLKSKEQANTQANKKPEIQKTQKAQKGMSR